MRADLSVSDSISSVPSTNGHMARLVVVQRRELLDASPADGFHHAFADPTVEVAHELRVGLGELAERAVEELDADRTLGGAVAGPHGGLETEPVELVGQRRDAAAGAGPAG